MRVFKNYFKIVKGHMTAIMIYYLVFFILLAISVNTDNTGQYTSIDIAIYVKDRANSKLAKAFYSYLDEEADIVEMEEKLAEDKLFYGVIGAIVEIPENFDKDREVVYKTQPGSTHGMAIESKVNSFINKVNTYENAGLSQEEAIRFAKNDLDKKVDVTLNTEEKEIREDGSNYYFNFLNYLLMAQIILIVSTVTGAYSKKSLMQRSLISPVSESRQNFELILGHMAIALIIWFSYIIFFMVKWQVDLSREHIQLMTLNSFVFTTCVVALAVFITRLIKSGNARDGVMNVISLGSSFLAGAFVPQELLGTTTLKIARILPSYYYITNNNMITNGANLGKIMPNICIILAFMLSFVVISVVLKRRH